MSNTSATMKEKDRRSGTEGEKMEDKKEKTKSDKVDWRLGLGARRPTHITNVGWFLDQPAGTTAKIKTW